MTNLSRALNGNHLKVDLRRFSSFIFKSFQIKGNRIWTFKHYFMRPVTGSSEFASVSSRREFSTRVWTIIDSYYWFLSIQCLSNFPIVSSSLENIIFISNSRIWYSSALYIHISKSSIFLLFCFFICAFSVSLKVHKNKTIGSCYTYQRENATLWISLKFIPTSRLK